MRTLYLRNVPDEVVRRLEKLAAREATSVSSLAIRELTEASRRSDNPELLEGLPDIGIEPQAIIESLAAERADQ